MSPNKRIALNILATYGRSLLTLACGLFSGRWLLMALGDVDYGLFGVVGGLSSFVVFINSEMANAVGRYFAIAVGRAQNVEHAESGLQECWHWFNTALMIHTTLPLVLVAIGYPIGEWLVLNFLNIPPDRVSACVWVWRITCLSSFLAMVTVPFLAMYTAKQYIAERTAYEVAQTVLNVVFMYYMVEHPQAWLVKYAMWMLLLTAAPKLIMSARAVCTFPECRIHMKYWWDMVRLRELASFAGLRLVGSFSWMLQNQAIAILINKFLGASRNAAAAIGNNVASHTTIFASSMSGALWPAAMNAYGEGNLDRARLLASQASKIGTVLLLVFALPVALEVDELLKLWLVNPPEGSAVLAVFILGSIYIDRITNGHELMIYARGKIAFYEFTVAVNCILTLVVCAILLFAGLGILAVGISFVFQKTFDLFVRLYIVNKAGDLSAKMWVVKILAPISLLVVCTILFGLLPRIWMEASFLRVICSTLSCEAVFIPFVWFVVLDWREREYMSNRLFSKFHLRRANG